MTQRDSRGRGRTGLTAALAAVVVGASLAALPATAVAAPPEVPDLGTELGKQDRDLLVKARREGKSTVEIQVMADQGVDDRLVAAGAEIRYRADELGYLRAEVPIDAVEKMAAFPGVDALNVDRVIKLGEPDPLGIDDPAPQPAPGPTTPRVNPYMPTGDIGTAQFVDANPKFDGRGVTVGIVDTGVDLAHPALNTTSTGEDKIVDWVTATDPSFDESGVNNDDDPTWIDMSSPAPGQPAGYRYGLFDERDPRLAGELGNDVNRDGNPAGSIGTFGVLWDPATNTVWVDTDQDKSFADQDPMTDFKVKRDVGTFGRDNPATPVHESMPFVVQTNPETESVNIGIVSGAHGSHVAGIVAANKMFGGTMSGAAPGAKLVSVRACSFLPGCTSHALDEGMIYAARDADVDVINMSIGGLDLLNHGQSVRELLYNRLIDTYDVQMFLSAGNSGAGMNTAGTPSLADRVISVGSYISRATWQRNYGSDAGQEDNMHGFSSRGPREDGGFKPNVIAPGSAISPIPMFMNGNPLVGTYPLPPGYGHLNGTSMASPQTAGAAAVLVSAALQRNVEHSPAQLRQALVSTTRFIPGYGAYEQGNGLVDVRKAWNALRANIDTIDISSSVPVNTVLSDFLATPDVGTGIYDREGVRSGDRFTREYTFKRTSGPASPLTFKVSWVGNDGTFSSGTSITLPKNSAVKFRVTVNPRSAGAHSAILNLDSPMTTGIEYQTMNTVVAAEDFAASGRYEVRHGGQLGRNETDSYFVRVPAGTPALKVDLQGGGTAEGAGQLRFLRFHPYGVGVESNSTPNCYNPPVPPANGCDAGSPTSRTFTNPMAGVWEIVVEARRTSDAARAPYTVTASILGATVSPNPDVIASAQSGQPVARPYTLTNAFGQFSGRAVGTPLGSARIATPTIADGAQQQYPVTVAAGASQLRAKIGKASDLGADLDLLVFTCTSGTCVEAARSADGDSEEEVTIANPAPGRWVVLVLGFAVPAGSTTYDYVDVFSGPSFGAITINDANAPRPGGSSWTVSGTVTAGTAPAAGRVLYGNVQVRTDTGVLVGTGDVIVRAVTP
jgi:hypothetical protein